MIGDGGSGDKGGGMSRTKVSLLGKREETEETEGVCGVESLCSSGSCLCWVKIHFSVI